MLWEQCDLFEPSPIVPVYTRPEPPVRVRPARVTEAPDVVHTPRTLPRTHPQDKKFVDQLTEAHARYNRELFGNELRTVPIRISRRMKNRLGHYMCSIDGSFSPEIAISRRHIRRDSWDEVLHTLVHEMVHQWQDENRLPLDHGRHFRRKAREVGISARATRPVSAASSGH